MTEQEWLACTDPEAMLGYLRDKASDRKFRLFAVACCRRIWHLFTDERSRKAVEVAERFAEGLVTEGELDAARNSSSEVAWGDTRNVGVFVVNPNPFTAAELTVYYVGCTSAPYGDLAFVTADDARNAARKPLVPLLHDLIGNPFRPVALQPACPSWIGGTVPKLAQVIYDERRFSDLPILADALEEAGCSDPDILGHCRSEGPHVRGCWVVDLILGKS